MYAATGGQGISKLLWKRPAKRLFHAPDNKADSPGNPARHVESGPRPRPLAPRQQVIGGHGAADRPERRTNDAENTGRITRHAGKHQRDRGRSADPARYERVHLGQSIPEARGRDQ